MVHLTSFFDANDSALMPAISSTMVECRAHLPWYLNCLICGERYNLLGSDISRYDRRLDLRWPNRF
jgi:hypothetical protein